MAKERTPIKRSEQLAPLSRDHHEGLLLAWKIRQGIRCQVSTDRITAYCSWFWQHHLALHFKREEVVIPRLLPEKHPLVQQMLEEHQQIKRQLEVVQSRKEYDALEQLAQLVYDHIRFEERELFTEAENNATPEQLQEVAALLKEEKPAAVWEDAFWLSKE